MFYHLKYNLLIVFLLVLSAGYALAQTEAQTDSSTQLQAEAPAEAPTEEPVAQEVAPEDVLEETPEDEVEPREDISSANQLPPSVTEEEIDENGYVTANIRNISKLYFKYGYRTPENREALTSLLAINECPTFRRYRTDDIEWTEILNSYAEAMPGLRKEFPRRFVFSQVLNLGDYDANTEIFEVYGPSKIEETTLFMINAQATQRVCGAYVPWQIPEMPTEVVFRTNVPFTLTEFKAPPEVARRIIDLAQKKYDELKSFHKQPDRIYDLREAYLFLYVDVFHMNEEEYKPRSLAKKSYPQFHVTLERVELYADPQKEKLLYSENFRNMREMDDFEKSLREEYAKRRAAAVQN